MKEFDGFKFKKELDLFRLAEISLLFPGSNYEIYRRGKGYCLHDISNQTFFLVETRRKTADPEFPSKLINAYEFVHNIKWSASVLFKEKLTVEDAKFIFDQSEKLLKDSVDSSNVIVLRTNTLITVLVALIIGLTSYLINELKTTPQFNDLIITTIIGVLYIYIISFFAIRNIYPSSYFLPGSLPKDLFNDAFFSKAVPTDGRIIRYYVSEIENYQFRIEKNNYLNGKRWNLYKQTLLTLFLVPVVFLVVYIIVNIIHLLLK